MSAAESTEMRKILLVDDDRIVRESIAAYLEDSGYAVIEAEDGYQALELFRHHRPELIICDLKMPRIDGLSLLRNIQEEEEVLPPTIVISGAGAMNDVVEALRIGACDYLVKPIADMKVLEHAIERGLERTDLLEQNRHYRKELEQANKELKAHLQVLEKDQQAGLQMQLKMFPSEPLVSNGYRIEHYIVPSLYLSGDFIEYVEYLPNRNIGFFIADVSGHGSSSAFVTAMLYHLSIVALRRARHELMDEQGNISPADILGYYNRELLTLSMDKYVTMFLGYIDTATNKLVYSVAGHLPMPILATAEHAEYLEGNGMPLGIVADVDYTRYEIQLPEVFSLALFSDGVLEILPAEGLLKKEELLKDIFAGSDRTLEGLKKALSLETVENPPDDIALMTVTRAGSAR
ncbi:MAG: SpoIIE family protein phosphatase [Pseudomonadales bacterium]|nr:SpoIIE family protein phosphatase [Pseudomonadales bacterium]